MTAFLERYQVPILIVIVLALVAGFIAIGYRYWYSGQLKVLRSDYCPAGTGPQVRRGYIIRGHTAILIDTSNKISHEDAKRAFQAIDLWTRDVAPWLQRLSVYGLPENAGGTPTPHGAFCVPKKRDDADRLYEHPAFVERAYQHFKRRMRSVLDEVVNRDEASQSPIVETMASLIQDGARNGGKIESVVLVSDMLQNTSLWDSYRREARQAGIERECRRITGPGTLREVFVYYIKRETDIQASWWPDDWWDSCLDGVKTTVLN